MTHRLKLLALVAMAIFAFAAISSTAAFAEENGLPSILPTPSAGSPLNFTSEALGEGFLKGVEELKSVHLENEGSFTSQRLGTVKLKFLETSTVKTKLNCKDKEATNAGEVLVFGDIHLVDLEIEGRLELGVVVIILGEKEANAGKSIIISCGAVKVEVKGAVIGLVDKFGTSEPLKDLEKVTKILVLFKEAGGKQAIKTCHLTKEFCEGKTYELLQSTGGAFTEAVEVIDDDITFAKEVEIHF